MGEIADEHIGFMLDDALDGFDGDGFGYAPYSAPRPKRYTCSRCKVEIVRKDGKWCSYNGNALYQHLCSIRSDPLKDFADDLKGK